MKQYKCVKVYPKAPETEMNLNLLAQAGWEVKCSYASGLWFIMEKEIEEMDIDDEDFVDFKEYADFSERESKAKRKSHPYSKTSRGKHSLDRKKRHV